MLELLPGIGEVAKSVGNLGRKTVAGGLSFAQHLLSGDDQQASATTEAAAVTSEPPAKRVTPAQEQGLQQLQQRLQSALQQRGISLDEPLQFSLDALGDVAIGDHPAKAEIESLLNSDPELHSMVKQLLQSTQGLSAANAPATAGSDWIFASQQAEQNLVVDKSGAQFVDAIR
ncbi:MAG: hypothetical protein ACO1RA_04605 [Planctomycetaceae bacterium]